MVMTKEVLLTKDRNDRRGEGIAGRARNDGKGDESLAAGKALPGNKKRPRKRGLYYSRKLRGVAHFTVSIALVANSVLTKSS